jgi:predicted DNA-binding transcriptional regulator AlpA
MGTDLKTQTLLMYPKAVQEFLGISRTQFYEVLKLHNFPKAKNLGKRPMYLRKEIEEWVNNLPS